MILLITEWDEEHKCEVVSHGVEEETGQNIVLPWMPPSYFNAVKDLQSGLWMLPADKPRVMPPIKKFN